MLEIVEETKPIPDTNKLKTFEFARRAPGVRAIIIRNNKIALSKEYRYEIGKYDYRLPGGKVFDSLEEYKRHLNEDLLPYAEAAVINECKQEVGFKIKNPKLIHISNGGGSIVWDLYFFEIKDFEKCKTNLEEGELVSGIEWRSIDEIKKLAIANQMSEDRSLGVLFRYFSAKEKYD